MNVSSIFVAALLAAGSPALVDARPLTTVDVVNLEEASNPRVSPTGQELVYSVRSTDYAADKYVSSIWLMQLNGHHDARRLAISDAGASSPRWSPDGKAIYFLSERSGTPQIWKTDATGPTAVQA